MKRQNLRIQAVQKEQVQLVQIENILTNILSKVNGSINELKVEELQIKSNLVEYLPICSQDDQPTTSAQAATRINANSGLFAEDSLNPSNAPINMEGIENINKQILALESLLVPLKHKNYSEEEDDDDMDVADDDEYLPSED